MALPDSATTIVQDGTERSALSIRADAKVLAEKLTNIADMRVDTELRIGREEKRNGKGARQMRSKSSQP